MFTSRPSVVVLSRGSTWNPQPWDPPYTLPADVIGRAWPDGAAAEAIFYDSSGGQLAIVQGTVCPSAINFAAGPDVMDLVPNGANFEIFITDIYGDPYQIRYGKVVRREAEFLSGPPSSVTQPVQFNDSWPTTGLRSSWLGLPPAPKMLVHDNSGDSLPNGIGAPTVLLGTSDAVMRWYRPLNSDSAQVKVNMLDQHSYIIAGYARFYVILGADQALNSYVAVEFEATLGVGHVNTVYFGTGNSPRGIDRVGSPMTTTIGSSQFTIGYDDSTDTLSVYKGTDLTPLGSWEDVGHSVPHGPGFRYPALRAAQTNLTDGLQATGWQAADV